MYRKFYNLTRKPFEMSPDPYFFYPTMRHNEALALLTYGVLEKKGFVVVSGEVGTGKTLLVRCLLDTLSRHKVAFAFVYNPVLSVDDFLSHILNDFGFPLGTRSKVEVLSTLNNFLLARSRRGETTALVVDEAQLLSWNLLEEIRLLTNLETTQFKLLQIVLVGQPELEQKLDSQELRQLKQRVAMRYRLKPLEVEDVRGYLYRRLELASASKHGEFLFAEDAIRIVHRYSRGIPRLINTICENSLIAGYGRQATQITPAIVQDVVADLCLEPAAVSLPVQPFVSGPDGSDEVWGALARIIEEGDELPGMSSQKNNNEPGDRTL